MTAHEIELWIAANDQELAEEVSNKCYDYVRMILSLTKNNAIVKYQCKVAVVGVDPRATFYGLPKAGYGDTWTREKGRKPVRSARRVDRVNRKMRKDESSDLDIDMEWSPQESDDETEADEANHQDDDPYIDEQHVSFVDAEHWDINNEEALKSWQALSAKCSYGNPLWTQLLSALNDARRHIRYGYPTNRIINTDIAKYKLLQDAKYVSDAAVILCREVIVNKDTVASSGSVQIFTACIS